MYRYCSRSTSNICNAIANDEVRQFFLSSFVRFVARTLNRTMLYAASTVMFSRLFRTTRLSLDALCVVLICESCSMFLRLQLAMPDYVDFYRLLICDPRNIFYTLAVRRRICLHNVQSGNKAYIAIDT